MTVRAPASSTTGMGRLLGQTDVLLAAGIIVIVGMMIIPLPPALLDILLTLNIAASVIVLLVAVYFVTRDWIWPPAPVTIGVLAAVLLAAAAGVALLLPRGVPSP